MHLLTLRPLFCQQFLYRLHDPEPLGFSLHITGSKALVGPHGRFNVGCFAVLLDKLIGRAVDVEIGGHAWIVHRIFVIGNARASVIGTQYDLRYTREQLPQGGSP